MNLQEVEKCPEDSQFFKRTSTAADFANPVEQRNNVVRRVHEVLAVSR